MVKLEEGGRERKEEMRVNTRCTSQIEGQLIVLES